MQDHPKHTQHPILRSLNGGRLDEEAVIREAYSHVAAGYADALRITGLPSVEREGLQACLLAALDLAGKPRLSAAPGSS